MKKNVIHLYFKKKLNDHTILVQVDPETFRGLEIIIHPKGQIEKTKMEFDNQILEDLAHDQFVEASALEFNLYLKGLVQSNLD